MRLGCYRRNLVSAGRTLPTVIPAIVHRNLRRLLLRMVLRLRWQRLLLLGWWLLLLLLWWWLWVVVMVVVLLLVCGRQSGLWGCQGWLLGRRVGPAVWRATLSGSTVLRR